MRNTDQIPEKEFIDRTKKFNHLLQEPYRKALNQRQSELFHNPKCNKWRSENGNIIYGMIPECQHEWNEINNELDLFRKIKYPELLFPLEDDEKQKEVELLKQDEEYKNLIKGITYHSGDIHKDNNAIDEIAKLNQQISKLIIKKYPNLFY